MNENNAALATIDGETGEILQTDAAPFMAISIEESRQRIQELQRFVREQMIPDTDYGVIPGTKKPSLYKPGAEKLNAIFGLSPHVAILDKTVDVPGGYVAYEVKVTLVHKATGRIEAEGVGSCNSQERKYKNQAAADMANTVLKMAKKRALVDATLSATRCSGGFTQDVEDMPRDAIQRPQQPAQQRSAPPAQQQAARPPLRAVAPPERPQQAQQPKLTPMQELMAYADAMGMMNPTPNELLDALKLQGADFKAVNAGNLAAAKVHIDNFIGGTLPADEFDDDAEATA